MHGMARWLAGLAAALVFAGASEADARRWLRADSPSFIVYSDAGENALRRQITNLETFDAVMRAMTNAPTEHAPARLEVFLLRSAEGLRVVKPSEITTRIGGFYHATPDITAAFVYVEDSWDGAAQHTLFHEYAHHFMMQYFPTAYPIWYGEGFAEYFAPTAIRGDRVEVGYVDGAVVYGLAQRRWMPTSRVLTERTSQLNEADATSFYTQSWAMVHYIYSSNENQSAFRAYHAGLLQGADPVASFATHFGKTPEEFDEELRRYVRGRIAFRRFDNFAAQHNEVRITELPESADDLLLLDARVRGGVPEAEMPALLQQIREAAAPFPNDVFAQTAVARAVLAGGDTAGARAILDPLSTANPDDGELHYLRGRAHYNESQSGASRAETQAALGLARRAFGAAHRVDPNHAAALHLYARASNISDDNTLNVILLAHDLRPQVQEFAFDAAYALATHQRYGEAAALIRPLAYDPHGAGDGQLRQMLAEFEQRAAETPPSASP